MRVALLADIHANLAALEAVLDDAESMGAEAIWQMGDIVGYGPDPDAVIRRLIECRAAGVLGNHDAAAIGLIGLAEFNPLAAEANRWTARCLGLESVRYLRSLPRVDLDGECTRVHGTLRDPLWEYLSTYEAAEAHFELQVTRLSIIGHTHVPVVLRCSPDGQVEATDPDDFEVVDLAGERVCINPGGLGQPRDGDPRAPYALLDTTAGTVSFRRVEYDIAATQQRMSHAGLPPALVARLAIGR